MMKQISTHKSDYIATLTLNRPESANALSKQMAEELTQAINDAEGDSSHRVLILTGSGNRAFCAGADLKERENMPKDAWHSQHHAFESAVNALFSCKKPVIAAVNGAAFGGGFELALACDFMYASDTARFALPEASLGIMPGMGGTQTLPRAIGTKRAKELLFTGRSISAAEAFAFGLVNRLCAPDDLIKETLAAARVIAGNAPLSLRAIKNSVHEGTHMPLKQALAIELSHYETLLDSRDRVEGITAWNEKQKPVFLGQ